MPSIGIVREAGLAEEEALAEAGVGFARRGIIVTIGTGA
jgi:hypothetical protein